MNWGEIRDWLQILNLILIPGVWWAAKLTVKVDALTKAFSRVHVHEAKIAVLEERTGGPIRVGAEL